MKTERTPAAANPLLKPAFNKAGNHPNRDKKLSSLAAEDQRLFDRDLETLLTDISTIMSCAPEAQAQTDERIRTMMLGLKIPGSQPDLKNIFALQVQRVANRANPVAELRIKTRKPRCRPDAVKKEKKPSAEWQRLSKRRPPNGFHPSGRRPPHIRPDMTAAEISAYMAAYEAAKASRLPTFADGSWLSPRPA